MKTDNQLQLDVSAELAWDPSFKKISAPVVKADIEAALKRRAQNDARDISVSVHGSDVTLSGKAHSWSERELATNTAWGTPGVRKVVDNITLAY
jgi:osmotically-inducible protein OsmY